MSIRIIAVGKIKEKYLREGINEYKKRLAPWINLHEAEVKESKNSESPADAVKDEGEKIMKQLRSDSYIIALSPEGRQCSSIDLAKQIETLLSSGKSKIDIIIGGPEGLSSEIKKGAHLQLSLSRLTFSSQIARFIIAEQLFRVMKIIKKEPYHR